MPQYATAGKKAAEGPKKEADQLGIRGSGHHNLVIITDYATGDKIFRAETEIHQVGHEAAFAQLEVLLAKGASDPATNREIVGILHGVVDAMPETKVPDGKQRAKAIFSAAFGVLRLK